MVLAAEIPAPAATVLFSASDLRRKPLKRNSQEAIKVPPITEWN
jgi:hypothetical protein